VLSGPTFANEIARGLPAAVSCASTHAGFAEQVAELFRNEWFRVYTSTDMIGVEIGGAVKNVLAIAAGIADGLGFGANTRAALITRGLREIVRLGAAMGGQPESFMGLAGLGDLVLTCTDDQSRNRRFGLALARGLSVAAAEQSVGQVVEGVGAAREVMRQARKIGVEMPIAEQVNRILHEGAAPADAVHALLARPPGAESE
jgi:glycerol-3-phosphate dehydrogenase (NAD(P)+)